MEFVLFGLLMLSFPIIAIVALVKTINIGDRLRALERRFAAYELRATGAPGAAPPPVQSPVQSLAPAAEPPAPILTPEPIPAPEAAVAPPPVEPAQPERTISFEEKFGTRWTVWIGGVALALGGIFLVKYSIEAGLIGPGLRLF
ncbi:MAG: DUF2339 domain-containing protein, partial [Xanthobacteraceae bacterium]